MYGSGSRSERLGGGRLLGLQIRKVIGIGGRAAWPAQQQQQQLSGSLVAAVPHHFPLLPRSHKDGIFFECDYFPRLDEAVSKNVRI